jgi:hypothetical protein
MNNDLYPIHPTIDQALAKARSIGRDHGEVAANAFLNEMSGWQRSILRAKMHGDSPFEDGLCDYDLPESDLSGQWADGYTPVRLREDCNILRDQDYLEELCDAYDEGFHHMVSVLVTKEIER